MVPECSRKEEVKTGLLQHVVEIVAAVGSFVCLGARQAALAVQPRATRNQPRSWVDIWGVQIWLRAMCLSFAEKSKKSSR